MKTDKTLRERFAGLLFTYGGNQQEKSKPIITFNDGLGLMLNYLNLEDEIHRLEKYEVENIELRAYCEFANKKIKELEAKIKINGDK